MTSSTGLGRSAVLAAPPDAPAPPPPAPGPAPAPAPPRPRPRPPRRRRRFFSGSDRRSVRSSVAAPFAGVAGVVGAGRVSPTLGSSIRRGGASAGTAAGGRRSPICGSGRRRGKPGLLASDVGDVVSGEAAVGGRVGVVVGNEGVGIAEFSSDRFDVVGSLDVVCVGRRAVRGGRTRLLPPVAPAARATASTRARRLTLAGERSRHPVHRWSARLHRARHRGASTRWARRWGWRPLRPPASCRRTLVPSLMTRAPPGRARARRLPAVPTARRRARSIVQF